MAFRALVILSSLVLMLIHIGMGAYSLHDRRQAFGRDLSHERMELEQNFQFALAEKQAQLSLLASMAAADPQAQQLIDAGIALDALVSDLQHHFAADFAILLPAQQNDTALPDSELVQSRRFAHCECYLEATSSPQVQTWLEQDLLGPLMPTRSHRVLEWNGGHYHLARFPLHDYGAREADAAVVRDVVVWQDISLLVASQRERQNRIYLILVLSYLITQSLLLLVIFRLRNVLQRQINLATTRLEAAHNQLDTLLSCSPVVTYQVPVPGSSPNYIGPNIEQLLGYSSEEVVGHGEWWFEHIHPLDRAEVVRTLEWRHWPAEGVTRRYRMQHKDGSWHWVEDRCRVTWDSQGAALLNGALIDITQQRETEQALMESEQRLIRAQAVAQVGSWEYREDSDSLNWSLETYRIFDIDPSLKPTYALFIDCVHPDDRQWVEQAWQRALQGASFDIEHRILRNGAIRWVREVAELYRNSSDVLIGAGVVQDITEQKERELELRRLASTDMLTGLPNRRYFMKRLLQELARARRHANPCSLMMLDLDHFKQVNDQYGHATGDQLLQAFAQVARKALRTSDIIARLGGEEFAALLPEAELEGGQVLAERLREAVSQIRIEGLPELQITISIGLTQIEQQDESGDAVLSRADKALYRAKSCGRNRVDVGLVPGPRYQA